VAGQVKIVYIKPGLKTAIFFTADPSNLALLAWRAWWQAGLAAHTEKGEMNDKTLS
jgi:hypothetical protein